MLVDTNVLSELMRARPNPRVVAWAKKQTTFDLSVITLEELWFGLSLKPSARMEAWVADFLAAHCRVLPITDAIARKCALMRGSMRLGGRTRTQADMLIAATAWEHRLTLATRNVSDFENCGVSVVNPFEP